MNILVIGAHGQVGSEVMLQFQSLQHKVMALTRNELDCTDLDAVLPVLSAIQADLIINASAYTAVDKAEDEAELAHIVNAEFVGQLARYCEQQQIALIHLSTDYVFDGKKKGAYQESDPTCPQGVYAQSKLAGEQAICSQLKKHLILRVSWVFGVYGSNFVKTILKLASSRSELGIVADQWGRPTAARDIARVLVAMVEQIESPAFNAWGVYHYAGAGITNWYEFAGVFIAQARQQGLVLPLTQLKPIRTDEYVTRAARPENSVLDTQKIERVFGIRCQSWHDYLPEVIAQFMAQNADAGRGVG